ncbi:MAG: hypothetical protein AAF266_11140 [Planctomycetota bacterium]
MAEAIAPNSSTARADAADERAVSTARQHRTLRMASPPIVKRIGLLTTLLAVGVFASADEGVAPKGLAGESSATETIRERDAAGRVRVCREVRLNERGDYVNHGSWRSWDEEGQLIGQGRYAWGKPTGVWSRWAIVEDAELLSTAPFAEYAGPFLSQASYRDGKLDGKWSIFDVDGRLVSEIEFRDGQRHGDAVLYSADGKTYRRSRFDEGLANGPLQQRNSAGELETLAVFESGRRRVERVERFDAGGLKSRESWLGGLTVAAVPDDPWRLRLARYEARGDELRDGLRETWWPNGQPKLRAEYLLGEAISTARWWHENGQLAIAGSYEEGLAAGEWSWWRENGVRAAACRYVAGRPAGELSRWAADGRRLPPAKAPQIALQPTMSRFR